MNEVFFIVIHKTPAQYTRSYTSVNEILQTNTSKRKEYHQRMENRVRTKPIHLVLSQECFPSVLFIAFCYCSSLLISSNGLLQLAFESYTRAHIVHSPIYEYWKPFQGIRMCACALELQLSTISTFIFSTISLSGNVFPLLIYVIWWYYYYYYSMWSML